MNQLISKNKSRDGEKSLHSGEYISWEEQLLNFKVDKASGISKSRKCQKIPEMFIIHLLNLLQFW